jgi:hypothetical protein
MGRRRERGRGKWAGGRQREGGLGGVHKEEMRGGVVISLQI